MLHSFKDKQLSQNINAGNYIMKIIARYKIPPFLLCCLFFIMACVDNSNNQQQNEAEKTPADTIYFNAKVYTVNEQQPWAEAIAIRGDEIVFVGASDDAKRLAGDTTTLQDMENKLILPGFIDSHMHPIAGGAYVQALSLDTYAQPADWIKAVAGYANENKDKPVIFGYGFLASAFGADGPNKAALDQVVPDRPVLLMDEGFHGAWANSKALEVLNITKDTADITPGFSYYKRDENNEPTGYLLEDTAGKAMSDLEVLTLESVIEGSAIIFSLMNSYGITAVFDAGALDVAPFQVDILKNLQQDGKMNVRYVGSYMALSPEHLEDAVDTVDQLRRETSNERFDIHTLKIMNDGTVEGKTAAMFEDYQGDPGNKGKTVFSQQQLNILVGQSAERNIDVHIHALGDRSIHEALNAIELARTKHKESDSRFTLCHVQILADEDLKRFAELDVIAQSTPLWAAYDEQGKKYVNDDQFNRYFRYNSLKKHGVKLSFGSDFPASGAGTLGISPIFNMEIGHTRQSSGDKTAPIQPNKAERLDIASLIRGYTLDSAYQLRMENEIGSLEVGKKADLVVLDQNLFDIDPYTFSSVNVLRTVLGGEVVYQHQNWK